MRLFLPQREAVRPVGGLRAQRLPWAWWLQQRQRKRREGGAVEPVVVPAPTAFWRLNELDYTTRNDSVGANHLAHSGLVMMGNGRMGYSAEFDMWDYSSLVATDTLSLRPENGSFSISIWLNPTSDGLGFSFPLAKHYYDGDSYEEGYYMTLVTGKPAFTIFHDPVNALAYDVYSATAIAADNWAHLVVTFSRPDNRARLYVDGVLKDEDTGWTAPIATTYDDFWVGTDEEYYYPFDGKIDGLGWFKGVELTAAQVAELHTGLEYYSGGWHLVAPA